MIMPRVLYVMANELRARRRDHTLLVIAFVGPLLFATITSLAFAGLTVARPVRLVVVDGSATSAAGGPARAGVVASLRSDPRMRQIATVDGAATEQEARRRILDNEADAGIVLPAGAGGLTQAAGGSPATAPRNVTVTVLESERKPVAAGVAEAVVQYGGGRLFVDQVVIATLRGTVDDPAATLRGFHPHNPVSLVDVPASARLLRSATYYGFSMAIVLLLFSVTPMAKSLWEDRRSNALRRLLSMGVGRGTIVAGKALVAQLIGMVSVAAVWVTTRLVFGSHWGPPAPLLLLIAATVGVAVALSFAIAALVRTEEQMDGLTALVTFLLVLLGGNFVPPAAMPPAMRDISLFTPNGWELRGFVDLATTNGGVGLILTPLVVLLAVIGVLWLIAAARLRTLMSP
ncbi:MAG TPA: ABC transporter permease [Streptosporangiaceae bacterium]